VESHYDIQPVIDIFASPDQRDLGGFATDIEGIIAKTRATLPRGTTIDLRGQVDTMRTSFTRLGLGMIFAVVLVYLVMAVNFQSWLDPFIILMALPGAMAGMLWMLYLTRHHSQRSGADGRDHGHRRCDGQQHPAGHVRK
jgi:multidrug efflux pump subunit AcrB